MEVNEGDFVTHNGGIYLVLTNSYAHDTIATRMLAIDTMTESVVVDIDTKPNWIVIPVDAATKVILMAIISSVKNLLKRIT